MKRVAHDGIDAARFYIGIVADPTLRIARDIVGDRRARPCNGPERTGGHDAGWHRAVGGRDGQNAANRRTRPIRRRDSVNKTCKHGAVFVGRALRCGARGKPIGPCNDFEIILIRGRGCNRHRPGIGHDDIPIYEG